MAFGVFTGTFSSIYVAGAILLYIEHRWPRSASPTQKGTARALAEERRRADRVTAVEPAANKAAGRDVAKPDHPSAAIRRS